MPSFVNEVTRREVSLAIERILIAPSTQVWTPGRITLSNTQLPPGFRDLGAVVEDSVTLTFSKEAFELYTGIPRVLQYTAIVALSGRLEVQFHSFSPRKMAYALGNVDPVNYFATIYALHANTAQNYDQITVNTPGYGGLKVGDVMIAAPTTPDLSTTDNEAEIASFGTGANTLQINMTAPGFPTKPETNWFVAKLTQVAQPFGTVKIKEFHILGVADTIDGYQIVHDLAKARVGAGDFQDGFRPTENAKIQAVWSLLGYKTNRYEGTEHLIIGERFWFPKE